MVVHVTEESNEKSVSQHSDRDNHSVGSVHFQLGWVKSCNTAGRARSRTTLSAAPYAPVATAVEVAVAAAAAVFVAVAADVPTVCVAWCVLCVVWCVVGGRGERGGKCVCVLLPLRLAAICSPLRCSLSLPAETVRTPPVGALLR